MSMLQSLWKGVYNNLYENEYATISVKRCIQQSLWKWVCYNLYENEYATISMNRCIQQSLWIGVYYNLYEKGFTDLQRLCCQPLLQPKRSCSCCATWATRTGNGSWSRSDRRLGGRAQTGNRKTWKNKGSTLQNLVCRTFILGAEHWLDLNLWSQD